MKLQKKFLAIVLLFICFNGFSQINVTTNFNIQTNLPIDTRMVVASPAFRDAISSFYRYEGLLVYVISNKTNYQLVGGIANANWQTLLLTGSVYDAGTGLTLSGNTFSHSPHTGDVTGTTSLTITAIQGRTLATITPTSGDVITWNGSAWAPAAALGTQYVAGTGIILAGNTFSANTTASIWNASQLQGKDISVTSPLNNEVLKWDGTEWSPATDVNTFYSAGTGLSLSGTTFSANNTSSIWNASQIQGQDVSATPPTNNQVLKWNGSIWTPVDENAYAAGTGITLSGSTFSANNSSPIWNADKLMGSSISTTVPSANQLLKWNGSEWVPADEIGYDAGTGIILLANTFTADNLAPIWNANLLWGNSISSALPNNNQLLKWNGTEWMPADETAYSAGTGIILSANTFTADNTAPIWNANQLNGTAISTTAPAGNEILKWNGSEWVPAADNNTTYTSGTGIILTGNTFSAVNTSPIWNANQLNSSAISSTAPAANEILKWNGSEWTPLPDAVNIYSAGSGITLTGTTFSLTGPVDVTLGGTGQTTYTGGQLLIGNTSGGLTKNVLTPGSGISITNGNGVITITNTDLNATHTGDAIGSSAITVVGLQGRSVATTIPTNGDVLTWNSSTSDWIPSQSSSAFDGSRPVKRATWPASVNMGTTTNVAAFLDAVFFPFLSASISMNNQSELYEVGTSNSVTISGSTTIADETSFSNGKVNQTYPTISTVFAFGAANSYSTSISFTPDQSIPASLELRFVAYQEVGNNGSPTTINSPTKFVRSCYPYIHGVSSDDLTAGGTNTYAVLSSGKTISLKANQTVSLTGNGYIYFCYPQIYGSLTSILDQSSFEWIGAFTKYSKNVTSSGLTNNWTEPYFIYQSNSQTTPSGWNYQFKY